MTDMGMYHDIYLTTDVLLLADVFENFRKTSMINYGLDPAHYITLPNFAWVAMLKKTGVELDLITDVDMFNMVEKGKRGGMCQVSQRFAEANNPYMGEDYDKTAFKSYLMYLDANNLYGLAMSKEPANYGLQVGQAIEERRWDLEGCRWRPGIPGRVRPEVSRKST